MLRHTEQRALQFADQVARTVTGKDLPFVLGRLEDATRNRINVEMRNYDPRDEASLSVTNITGRAPRQIVADLGISGKAKVWGIHVRAELAIGSIDTGDGGRQIRALKLGVAAIGRQERKPGILKFVPGLQNLIALQALKRAAAKTAQAEHQSAYGVQVSGNIVFDGVGQPLCPPLAKTAPTAS